MNLKNVFFLTSLIWVFIPNGEAQSLSFYKEDLTFRIEGDNFYVNGLYYLKCTDEKDSSLALFYPFPTGTAYAPVDSLFIFNITRSEEITDYAQNEGGVLLYPGFDSMTTVLIAYRQKFFSKTVKYILTSTQFWDKPLEQVNYQLIVDCESRIKSFSYQPDRAENFGNKTVYYWERQNFMPKEDMVFYLE